ncbi:hypothetical protein HRbin01_00327 [archaeon HR01]|nr:hypothetical protein HRbin01_00327 [archaeon HR01]
MVLLDGLADEGSETVVKPVRFRIGREGVAESVGVDVGWFTARGYGELEPDGLLRLSPVEALYLTKYGRVAVEDDSGHVMGFEELFSRLAEKTANLWRDYVIYMDLRNRRYVVKEGFSPHLRFRVFERGTYPESAAKYLIIPVYEGDDVVVEELLEYVRACRAMNKTAVVAVVDRRNEIVYYTVSLVNLINP